MAGGQVAREARGTGSSSPGMAMPRRYSSFVTSTVSCLEAMDGCVLPGHGEHPAGKLGMVF